MSAMSSSPPAPTTPRATSSCPPSTASCSRGSGRRARPVAASTCGRCSPNTTVEATPPATSPASSPACRKSPICSSPRSTATLTSGTSSARPHPFLDLILQDLGNPFAFDLDDLSKRRLATVLVEMKCADQNYAQNDQLLFEIDVQTKRRLAAILAEIYRSKGTAHAIRDAVRFLLGVEVEVLQLTVDSMTLGQSEIGVDWVLGPSDRFAKYAFDLRANRHLTDQQRRQVRWIVDYLKPAHTHFVNLYEPTPTVLVEGWELGISSLGLGTLLK